MQLLEYSDSIMSDEQSLELDCRIIIPKFKKEEYDTFQTEIYNSVMTRVMEMRSNSQEFRFKQPNQFSPQSSINSTQKRIQCTLLNSDDHSIQFNTYLPEEEKRNPPSNSVKSNKDSPKLKKYCENTSKMTKQCIQSPQKQSTLRSNKRQLSQTFKNCSVEASPLKITGFSQRQIYVTQLVNTYQEPIQEKLSLVQLENNEKQMKVKLSPYSNKTKRLRYLPQKSQQLKGILKSKSCNSEGSRKRQNGMQELQNTKSNFFKKVTFISNKLNTQLKCQKDVLLQQLIIMQ